MFITDNENLKQPTLQAFIKKAPSQKDRRLEKVFPEEEVFDIDNFFDVVTGTGVKAGSLIGFDAETPIRRKPELQQATVSLSKIAHAHHYTETELYKYFNARNENESRKIVSDQLLSVNRLAEGIDDMKEYMRSQMAYYGKFEIEDPKSQLKVGFDLDLPESAFMSSDSFTDEDTNPLREIEKAVEQYKDNNAQKDPAYMVMNSKTFAQIKRNPNVSAEVYGNESNGRMVRNSDLDEAVNELGLPPIAIDDNRSIIEGIEGEEVVKHLGDGIVVLHAEELGRTLTGPAADNEYQSGKYVVNVRDRDPISEKTIVGEVTMPVLQNVTGVVILNTNDDNEEDEGEEDTP